MGDSVAWLFHLSIGAYPPAKYHSRPAKKCEAGPCGDIANALYQGAMQNPISPAAWRSGQKLTLGGAAARVGVGGKNPARTWQRWETGELVPPISIVVTLETISGGALNAASWAQVRQVFLNERKSRASDNKAARASGSSSSPTADNRQSPLRPAQPGQEEVGA